MIESLNILLLEDSPTDAEITRRLLLKKNPACNIKIATDKESYLEVMGNFVPDIILSDHALPQFNSLDALKIGRERFPGIPFILVTGTVSEEFAAEIIKSGADDYILKDRQSRLPSAIDKAISYRRSQKERQDAEHRIRESESNLRAIVENTNEGFLLMDASCIVKSFNKKSEEYGLFSIEKKMKVGDTIFDYVAPSLKKAFKEIVDRVLMGETVQYERHHEVKNDADRWIYFSITPVMQAGRVMGICISGEDITSKKKIELEREFERNNMAALINNTPDLMWSIDREFRLIACNEAFDKHIKEARGTPFAKGEKLFSGNFPEKLAKAYKSYYKRALAGEQFTEIVYNEMSTGFYSEISFYPIHNRDKIIGTACFSRDITERKRREAVQQRNSSIIEATPDFVGIASIRQEVLFLNKGGRVMTGYGEHEDLSRMSISQFVPEDSYKYLAETGIPAAIQKGEWAGEFILMTKTGKKISVSAVIIVHTNEHGQPEFISTIIRDISERIAAEENLKNMEQAISNQKLQVQKKITQAVLNAQEKERNHLGQELHDNVNQILAGTKLYMGMAAKKDEKVSELIKYPMELIDTSIHEIRMLCQRMVTPVSDIKLEELVYDLLNNLHLASIKTNFIYLVKNERLPDEIKLNIYRILQEQINNILKYAEATMVNVAIRANREEINIEVEDNGKGFIVKNKRNGIGILNMMNRIDSYNGTMEIISSPGNGCKITAVIPL
jgi:PAS domain S-box-containing protein